MRTSLTMPVAVTEKRFGYFPQRFYANRKEFFVSAVERTWTKAHTLIFQVKCIDEGQVKRFRLIQDVRADTWQMEI